VEKVKKILLEEIEEDEEENHEEPVDDHRKAGRSKLRVKA